MQKRECATAAACKESDVKKQIKTWETKKIVFYWVRKPSLITTYYGTFVISNVLIYCVPLWLQQYEVWNKRLKTS